MSTTDSSRKDDTLEEPFDSSLHLLDNKLHILLAASGSVATIKIPNIIQSLTQYFPLLSIRLILTSSASRFLQGQSSEQPSLEQIRRMEGVDGIYSDSDEWSIPWTRGAKILHIELRRWADIMIIAPLSANTLSKMAVGLCDNLLLSTIRAWDTTRLLDPPHTVTLPERKIAMWPTNKRKIIVVAPAMNTAMWAHPITKKHISVLEEEWSTNVKGGWIEVMRPMEKELACGDTGTGAMISWEVVVERVRDIVLRPFWE